MEMSYASRGVANAGLTTGIIGTALGALNSVGGLGAMALNGGRVAECSADPVQPVAQVRQVLQRQLSRWGRGYASPPFSLKEDGYG